MDWLNLLGIAIGLAMDALAVSLATGLSLAPVKPRQVFRLGFHFGLFQFLMPVIGWLLGREMDRWIGAFDHWVAFVLLSLIGAKMLWGARAGDEKVAPGDPTRGWSLVVLSVATSIDALAVGFSLAFLRITVWFPALVIGIVTMALSGLGMVLGSRLGRRWSSWADLAGGCILILIGFRILLSHLTEP